MQNHKPDYIFIALIAVWLIFGLLMLFSASAPTGLAKLNDAYFYIRRQMLFGVLPGLALLWFCSRLNFRFWERFAWLFLGLSVLLLILVLIPGVGGNYGTVSRSWLTFLGFSFQPAELAKLALILALSAWFSRLRVEDLSDWRRAFLPFVLVLCVVAGLILGQPDLGTLTIIILIALSVYFASGVSWAFVVGLIAAFGVGFLALIVGDEHRRNRLLIFLNLQDDPSGAGYQINQALLAIGSGGFWGLGWGHSRQKFQYLPEVSADSIFAIIAEELGFIAVILFLLLLVGFLWRGIRLAMHAPNHFAKLVVVGVVVWLTGQTLVNISAMIGLLPLTGLPLPLISHGGTAMAVTLAALGIVINISKQSKEF